MNRKTVFISVAGLLMLVFVLAVWLFQDRKSGVQSGLVSSNQQALYRVGAPVKGSDEAKVTIVEFFDPACATCRDFNPLVKQILAQYSGKVKVMMRYAPLHPGSDQVVRMLEAAHRQGMYWQALERLFESQDYWVIQHKSQPVRALEILSSLPMDQERFSVEIDHPEVVKVVKQDVRDGEVLKVQATPEFFVNGRPMPSFGAEQLMLLVKEAVAVAY